MMKSASLLFCATAILSPAAAMAAPATHASAAAVALDIPAQPLANALQALARQAHINILFTSEATQGLRAQPVRGRHTPLAAAKAMIGNAQLAVIADPGGGLIIRQEAERPRAIRTAALQGSAAPSPAIAPPAPLPEERSGLEEIVVTAQKRAESLQDAPLSVTALSSEQLASRGVASIGDLTTGAIPSLRIAPYGGRSSSTSVTMRGITSGDATQISRDGAIGIYVDGVYLGRVQGLGFELFDIERMEVLRGPQGTLFGRNAVGGAINIISKRPTGELEGMLQVGIRNFDGQNARASLNLPSLGDLRLRVDGIISKRDGWVDNPMRGQADWNAYNRRGMRVSALWEPTSDISLLYAFDTSRDATAGFYPHMDSFLSAASPPLAPIFYLEPDRVSRSRAGVPFAKSVAHAHGHGLTAEWQASDSITLRSITAYRKLRQSQSDNEAGSLFAFTPNRLFGRLSMANVEQDQFSQEIQLVGSSSRFDYVLGAFYFEEDANDDAYAVSTARFNATGTDYTIVDPPVGGVFPDRASVNKAKSTALFAQGTWTPPVLEDRLHLTAGARYTRDRKKGRLIALSGVDPNRAYRFRESRVDPAFSVGFDVNDDVKTYLRYGVAYRAGGANSRSATFRTFGSEELRSWEAGVKTELFDRHLRVNVAAFTMRYSNLQLDFINRAAIGAIETVNTDDPARIKGMEVDVTATPARGLVLGGSYSYLHSRVPQVVNPYSGLVQDVNLTFAPRHAATASLDYSFPPLPVGDLKLHMDANYSSSMLASLTAVKRTEAYTLVNARATLDDIGGMKGVSLSAWMKNIFDISYDVFNQTNSSTGQSQTLIKYYNEPRTYGLELTYRF
ncbi:MAG: TonB-dependent receptor [Sphingobium sp.]